MKTNGVSGLARAERPFAELPEQFAAVCFRRRKLGFEFLLVMTRSGRWTFPKGGVEPGETASEAARREADEEGGVTGTVEERPLMTYLQCKTDPRSMRKVDLNVAAHLLEVHEEGRAHESHRAPTWFGPDEAKEALAAGRPSRYALSVLRVIDEAAGRLGA